MPTKKRASSTRPHRAEALGKRYASAVAAWEARPSKARALRCIAALKELEDYIDDRLPFEIEWARDEENATWQEIAEVFGTSRQNVTKRFGNPKPARPAPTLITSIDDLLRAMRTTSLQALSQQLSEKAEHEVEIGSIDDGVLIAVKPKKWTNAWNGEDLDATISQALGFPFTRKTFDEEFREHVVYVREGDDGSSRTWAVEASE